MSPDIINVGASPNDGQGDPIRTAFIKTNANFSTLFALPNPTPPVSLVGKAGDIPGMYAYNADYFYYCFGTWNGSTIIWAQVAQINSVSVNKINNGNSNVSIAGANANVTVTVNSIANLATFSTAGLSVNGNITGNYFIGNGSQLTGIISSYSNANVANFIASSVEIVSEITSNAYGHVIEANNTVLKLTDVSGRFDINDVVYDAAINAYADVTAIYTVNNTIESSSSFGRKYSQVARLTLTSNTGSYVVGEKVTQDIVQASGYVFNTDKDIDIVYENIDEGGSFNIGNEITDETTGATGLVTYANTTYLRVTAKNGSFVAGHTILNNVDIAATITDVYPVLILSDVKGNKFQQGTYIIVGDQSGAVGRNQVASTIIYPELVRDSGSVVYFENIAPITKSSTSKEKINLIIKF
jgi:hypothetical protein